MKTSKLNVLITRPEDKGRVLVQKLSDLGIRSKNQPLFYYRALASVTQIENTLAQTIKPLLIFVSVAAVRYANESLPIARWPHQTIFAVGSATTKALKKCGIDAVICPEVQNSEGLLALPQLTEVTDQDIIIIRGDGGRELMAQTLSQRGAKVCYLESYRRIWHLLAQDITEQWQAEQINCMVITSNALLEYMLNLLQPLDIFWKNTCLWIVASQRIADNARNAGLKQVINAQGADDHAITTTLLKQ